MAGPFAVTAATSTVTLDATRRGMAAFTVTNTSGQPRTGRVVVKAEKPEAEPWLSVAGEGERPFAVNEAQQFSVQIAVPADAPAGTYPFRLDVVGVENPDELYSEGPTVTVEVAPAAPPKKPFPWWIVVVAAVVALLVIGLVVWLLFLRGGDDNAAGDGGGNEGTIVVQRTFDIRQTFRGDLDQGIEPAAPSAPADIFFHAETADRRFIEPIGTVRVARAGTSAPSVAQCVRLLSRVGPEDRIAIQDVPAGTFVCARTKQNNIAIFRVVNTVGPSPGILTIDLTTRRP